MQMVGFCTFNQNLINEMITLHPPKHTPDVPTLHVKVGQNVICNSSISTYKLVDVCLIYQYENIKSIRNFMVLLSSKFVF